MKTVGILGGGQLGMLLMQSVYRLGADVIVYDPDPLAPACRTASRWLNNAWDDLEALKRLFTLAEVVTYEFENVESAPLFELETLAPILPSSQVLQTTQNRILEKEFLREAELPHVSFAKATDQQHLSEVCRSFEYPFIIKTARGGYDGKGQFLIASDRKLFSALPHLTRIEQSSGGLVLESQVEIAMEVSCIVARHRNGTEITYPVFENIHRDHILDFTLLPARLPTDVAGKCREIALDTARKLGVYGLLCVEFFLSRKPARASLPAECSGWYIYINELAPRPHNSGHVTMTACSMSQFDALARILLDVPLAAPQCYPGYFCMGNLLGDVWLDQNPAGDDLDLLAMAQHPHVLDVVIYGKREARRKRKMGHFVTHALDAATALAAANAFREHLSSARHR